MVENETRLAKLEFEVARLKESLTEHEKEIKDSFKEYKEEMKDCLHSINTSLASLHFMHNKQSGFIGGVVFVSSGIIAFIAWLVGKFLN